MALAQLCWLVIAAYGIHIAEEYAFNWRDWARSLSNVQVEWDLFFIGNALVIVIGIVCAEAARSLPMIALAFPALMLINATVFHLGAFLWTRGRFSPGLITAVVLFYPLGIWCYKSANDAGVLTTRVWIGSFALGALLMSAPILLLKARKIAFFR
jgi:hypothetical protein